MERYEFAKSQQNDTELLETVDRGMLAIWAPPLALRATAEIMDS
jgi:hypothetical protein